MILARQKISPPCNSAAAIALGAYFWYVTRPQGLAEEVLRHSKPTKRGKIFSATKP